MSADSNIQITGVQVIPLKQMDVAGSLEPAWDVGGQYKFSKGGGTFTEVYTNQGITGIGPGMDLSIVDSVEDLIRGQNPFEIEQITQRLKYYVDTLPYKGTAGVDMALWDIIGKVAGLPLYKLWGGSRNKVAPYAKST